MIQQEIRCPGLMCGGDCSGERVTVTDAGFAATTVTITACAVAKAEGVVYYEATKSRLMEATDAR